MSRPRFALRLLAALALVLLVAGLSWVLSRERDAAWARIEAGGALRVALDPSFPPFEYLDGEGKPVGFDIDLAQELGRRLGAPVTFQAIAFDGLVDAVLADKADVVVSAFPLDPRLSRDVIYSRAYFEAGLVLVTREGSNLPGPEMMAGQRVAVEWGSRGDAYARGQGWSALRKETAADALLAVAEGQADAALVDAVSAALADIPGLYIHTPPLESEPYVLVMAPRAPRLAAVLDEALADVLSDGTWSWLAGHYFKTMPPMPAAEE